MNTCIEVSDLEELTDSMVKDFERGVAGIPSELCAPFHSEAKKLEGQLLSIYRMVAMIARREQDLSRISTWWGAIVAMCDAFAEQLRDLAKKHPHCGADSYYDRVLDLRNKCLRLQQMHS
jgi:hypothetical protein